MKKFGMVLAAAMLLLAGRSVGQAASFVDVVVVVDESGSMSAEHAWLPGMINALNTELVNLGYTVNYGLFGFGSTANPNGRTLLNAGTAAQFGTAASNLVTSGSSEDGYTALKFASDNYSFTVGAARNYILVTDEDRDVRVAANTYATTLALLTGQNALLNAVLNNPFTCATATSGVIGRTNSTGYVANGSGGYTTCGSPVTGDGANNTETDYVPLALATGGAAWNLNILRAGGNSSLSFTDAFVDIKVQEIIEQTGVPEPSTYMMGGTALLLLGWMRRRQR